MRRVNSWKLALLLLGLAALIAAGFLVVWLIKTYGAIGGLVIAPLAGAGKLGNEIVKNAGGRKVEQSPGLPRHDGLNTNEPRSREGEKPRPKTPRHDSF